MSKRSLLILIVAGVFVALSAVAVRQALEQRARRKNEAARLREAAYQSALHSFSETLTVGMTRKEVEGYLRANGVSFFYGQGGNLLDDHPSADLTKIGNEDPPWYCSEIAVYIAFHFTAAEPPSANKGPFAKYRPSDTDTLKAITIFHQAEGCL